MFHVKIRFKYASGPDTVLEVPVHPIHGDWLWWLFQVPPASRAWSQDMEVVVEKNLVGETMVTLMRGAAAVGQAFRIP